MVERPATPFRSGDALFAFDADLTVVSWNPAAEKLTGVSADEAVGRHCWEVLGGHDERGNVVCHPGCATARLAGEGWPVPCQGLLIKARRATCAPTRSRSRRRTPVGAGHAAGPGAPRLGPPVGGQLDPLRHLLPRRRGLLLQDQRRAS